MALDIKSVMRALDSKNRDFFDKLSPEEKKKFSTFLMIRWGSCVGGSADLQTYYLQATNERLNKHFFDINKTKHDKLNWLTATTISPDMGNQYHQWIKQGSKEGNSKVEKFLRKVYPDMNLEDIKVLEQINDLATWKQLARDMGWNPDQIKKELG